MSEDFDEWVASKTEAKKIALRRAILRYLPRKALDDLSGLDSPRDVKSRDDVEAVILANWSDGETKSAVLSYLDRHT